MGEARASPGDGDCGQAALVPGTDDEAELQAQADVGRLGRAGSSSAACSSLLWGLKLHNSPTTWRHQPWSRREEIFGDEP